MVLSYPVVSFLKCAASVYQALDGTCELELKSLGNNLILSVNDKQNDHQLHGVIGVNGKKLELHAAIGFNEIITMTWPHAQDGLEKDVRIEFYDRTMGAGVSLTFNQHTVKFAFSLADKQVREFLLHKC